MISRINTSTILIRKGSIDKPRGAKYNHLYREINDAKGGKPVIGRNSSFKPLNGLTLPALGRAWILLGQYKLEARKILENASESPPSSARFVSPRLWNGNLLV
jgi:hypothetical protein